jgi:hypothetical protein
MVAGREAAEGKKASSARLTASVRVARNRSKSKSDFEREAKEVFVTDMRACFRQSHPAAQALIFGIAFPN